MNYVFAGNRDISTWILEFLIDKGYKPSALLITNKNNEHSKKLIELSGLDEKKIFCGSPRKNNNILTVINEINPDYIFGIHYPYIIDKELINAPKKAFLNLHPSYLPFNRGWHTPSWSILEQTPIGATLHEMSEKLDCGDIIHRKKIQIDVKDTAHSLYLKLKKLEFEVFKEAFSSILNYNYKKIKQNCQKGSSHKKKDLFSDKISRLDLNKYYKLDDLLRVLRALTTNDIREAAYFIENNKKYRIQVKIIEEEIQE